MRAVGGATAPGFESVADVLERSDLGRGGAAFAAYVDGERVIDLWAGKARTGVAWGEDTLTTAMSATKGMAALCAQVLSSRGLLDVEAPVSRYWPEYAQAGKQTTLVRHVLNHTSGMLCFDDPGAVLDWDGNGWHDYDEIARRIAASPPAWEPGTRIAYHAISVGWLIQELVRRVTGQTLGSFFAQQVAEPLGLSLFIGTPEEQQGRLAEVISDPPAVPEGDAGAMLLELFRKMLSDPNSVMAKAGVLMHGRTVLSDFSFFNLPKVRSVEIPAANASADARSLARAYAVLAQGGELDGVRLVSRESVCLFGAETFSGPAPIWTDDRPSAVPAGPDMRYALGYEGDFGKTPKPWRFGPTPTTFGHLGAGGQIGFADPDRHVAVGFLRSHLADWSVSTALIEELYRCLSDVEG
jgi:CubicO group peptidase (beta-lactamase class C family)